MKLLGTLLLLFFSYTLTAQTKCPCCEDSYKQFDFWEGNWSVLDTLGNKVGENKIFKTQGNCVLSENWEGAKGSTGTSINYYDRTDDTWNQLWVDNGGNTLKLKGGLVGGKMILKSDLIKGQKIGWYYNQITWSPNKDKTVSQLWEVYSKENKLLNTLFLGIYHKQED